MGKHHYKTLVELRHTGAQAEGERVGSSVVTFGADEAYQVHRIEIYPPRDGTGAIENLTVYLAIDGHPYMWAVWDSRMAPPINAGTKNATVSLELGNRKSVNPVENTCLKGVKSLQIITIGGPGGVTGDYLVRVKGDYWKGDDAIKGFFGTDVWNPTPVTVIDRVRRKSITIGRSVPITISNVANFHSHPTAPTPRVLPLVRFARNKNATTVNTEYAFSLEAGNVVYEYEDMHFDLTDKEALMLTAIGGVPHDNSKELWVEVGGEEFPDGRFDFRKATNECPIGSPDDYHGPRIIERPILAHNELVEVRFIDNGTSVPANGVLVAIWGKFFQLG